MFVIRERLYDHSVERLYDHPVERLYDHPVERLYDHPVEFIKLASTGTHCCDIKTIQQ